MHLNLIKVIAAYLIELKNAGEMKQRCIVTNAAIVVPSHALDVYRRIVKQAT
jgi:hypothetical protein